VASPMVEDDVTTEEIDLRQGWVDEVGATTQGHPNGCEVWRNKVVVRQG
jgi:hypothetical protein